MSTLVLLQSFPCITVRNSVEYFGRYTVFAPPPFPVILSPYLTAIRNVVSSDSPFHLPDSLSSVIECFDVVSMNTFSD